MNRIEKLLNDLFTLPYYRNYEATSGHSHNIASHEDAVEDTLIKNGLTKFDFTAAMKQAGYRDKKKFRDFLLDNVNADLIPEFGYCTQPTGKNNSPDFIFRLYNRVYFVECKSCKQTTPLFNSGLPKKGYIYHFCSSRTKTSTMFTGDDVLNDSQRDIIAQFKIHAAELVSELNKMLNENDSRKRGLHYYQRDMWSQHGGKQLTDYFSHQNRAQAEETVYALFKDDIEFENQIG